MVRLYIASASEDGLTAALHVVTSKKKLTALGEKSRFVFIDVAAGKCAADGDPAFELAGAKVGDVVWIGHFSTDLGEGAWITSPCRTADDASKAVARLAKSQHMPEDVRKGSGELRTLKVTIE